MHSTPPRASGRVLPTLNEDGSRNWIRPHLFEGRNFHRRRWVGWGLIALFVSLPLIPVGGAPAVLLDVPARKFHLFGATFLATDGVLLMLLMLGLFVAVFLVTSLLGRVWCGWGCPQTVYLEFVFRPIERWLEGNAQQQRQLDKYGANGKRVIKFVIYAALSVVLANVFLSYFVGVERLARWMTRSPVEHPSGFLIVFGVSALVLFDFAYFREQMCTVVCPYARLQSVLLDRRSLVVGYDARRGEPRGGGRKQGGDCIDCKACVISCPTGIDIRNGLQLECIGCTQCIDACDTMMDKVGKPRGLVAYTTQDKLDGKPHKKQLRPRVIIYSSVLAVLVFGLLFFGRGHTEPEVMVLRGIGAPYVAQGALIRNQLRVKLSNRSSTTANYRISLGQVPGSELIAPENPVRVEPGEQTTVGAFVVVPREALENGVRHIEIIVEDEHGFKRSIPYTLLGPANETL